MSVKEVLEELKSYGTLQNLKLYQKHGVKSTLIGVSFFNLKIIAKKFKDDSSLAKDLWASNNHDARMLAIRIIKLDDVNISLLNEWAADLDNYILTDALSALAAKSTYAKEILEQWTASKSEWICSAGWNILASLAMKVKELPESFFEKQLSIIEANIHQSPNRVRHCMNMALIAMGVRTAALTQKALKAAKAIGKVEVDHGSTDCKTPDAAEYIHHTLKSRMGKKQD